MVMASEALADDNFTEPPARSRRRDPQPLCPEVLWTTRCRHFRRDGACKFSHAVPPLVREHYDRLRNERLECIRVADVERKRAMRDLKRNPPAPVPVPAAIECLREEAVLRYDTASHPLDVLIAGVLECVSGEEPLHEIHQRALPDAPPLCPTLMHAYRLNGRKLPGEWTALMGPGRSRKLLTKLWASAVYEAWLGGYDAWVRDVVLPVAGSGGPIYYQRPPTLRVAMPSHAATIGVHRDADYPEHHPAEINFWCPLVRVGGTSALWLESAPGAGDYAPRALEVGDVLRFNGYLCRHHTVPNRSGTTRVSFDLRCLPACALRPGEAPPTKIGDYAVGYVAPKGWPDEAELHGEDLHDLSAVACDTCDTGARGG